MKRRPHLDAGELVESDQRLGRSMVRRLCAEYGCALSYYSVFSMAPLLLIVISIAGLIFGEDVARGEVLGGLRGLMGEAPAQAIDAALASMSKPANGFTSAALSGVMLLIGATRVRRTARLARPHLARAGT